MTAQPTITLHGVMSPNVVKVAIMLEELGLPYALKHVALFNGEQFTPEFRLLNPVGKVPVLEDPALGQPIGESGAILIWLAEHYGQFLPTEGAQRYEVIQWLMVQMANIGPMLGQFTHFRLLPEGTEPYSYGRYAALAKTIYQLINDRVSTREWIAGDAYSIADIATLPWAEYLERHDLFIEDYPALKRWREAVAARPAVIRAKQRMFEEFSAPAAETMATATSADLDKFFGRSEEVPSMDYSSVQRLSATVTQSLNQRD